MIIEDTIQGSHVRSFHQLLPRAESVLNILVACKAQKTPAGLEHLGAHRVLYSMLTGWANAANALLDQAAQIGGDALFCDDDVTFTAGCLDHVYSYYDQADIFGLDLHDMTGARQAGARHVFDREGNLADWTHPGTAYVAHVSTSAIYIKEEALSLRFPVWDGIHWEDVGFCLDAWLHGFKVMAVPGRVDHAIVAGVGSTKRHDPAFWGKWARNRQACYTWMGEHQIMEALKNERIPIGAREIT